MAFNATEVHGGRQAEEEAGDDDENVIEILDGYLDARGTYAFPADRRRIMVGDRTIRGGFRAFCSAVAKSCSIRKQPRS